MSHYISSFLIDPVIRQARRFSRPSAESEPSRAHTAQAVNRRGSNFNATSTHHGHTLAAAPAHEIQHDVGLELENSMADVTGDFEVLMPDSEAGGLEAELQAWTRRRGLASPLRHADSAPEIERRARPSRRFTRHSEIGTSSNPLYGASESLGSTNSSVSGSLASATDMNMASREDSGLSLRTTGQDTNGGINNFGSRIGNGSLPADDGMGHMRHKILAIQGMEITNAEKAHMIHELMTERYTSSQTGLQASRSHRQRSLSSMLSSDRPVTPVSAHSIEINMQSASPPTSMSSVPDSTNPFHLTLDDLRPTYFSKSPDVHGVAGEDVRTGNQRSESSETAEEPKMLGCAHYKRNIKLQCSVCDRWYTCRFCHDEVEDHSLNRRETKNMLCMLCGYAQPASEECAQCGERGAWYYCSVCKLWDDDSKKSIYHCNDCGICRVGQGLGKDFYHCKTCCVCLSISIWDTHRCIERSTDCDCPICGEYMFTSPQTVVFMRCGHSIHQRCYYEHMNSSYRCPICSRSIVNMEMQFRHLERAIDSQPMPPQFEDTKAFVYCNDCSAKTTVKYHWLGLKCAVCDSYNTAQIQILSGPDTDRLPSDISETLLNSEMLSPLSSLFPLSSSIRDASPRGRLMHNGPHQRLTTSASAAERTYTTTPDFSLRRIARSESPTIHINLPISPATTSESDPNDSMDTDGDYSDVDFWGRESPSGKGRSPLQNRTLEAGDSSDDDEEDENEDDDDDGDGDDDDCDEDMSDDVDIEEGDEGDRMEIFGHR